MSRVGTLARAHSHTSDNEVNEGLAEVELAKLQRQYRLLEGDRKAYSDEARQQLKKQRDTIEKLKKENDTLAEDVFLLEQRFDSEKQVGEARRKTQELLAQMDTYQRKMRHVVADIRQIEERIAEVDAQIAVERVAVAGDDGQKNVEDIDKLKRTLENRLDKAFVKFNRILSSNRTLRDQIDGLRRERLAFDNIYRKLERDLHDQKRRMAEIIESSNAAFESRDDIQNKTALLKERAEKEHLTYVQEIKEIDRALEQERKLKDFMTAKMAERAASGAAGDHHHRMHRGDGKDAGDARDGGADDDSLEAYERLFAQLLQATQSKDIYEVLTHVKLADNQNFSLFNYVNETGDEVAKLQKEIEGHEATIKALLATNARAEEHRQAEILALEAQLAGTTQLTDQLGAQHHEASETLNELQSRTTVTFRRLAQLDVPINHSASIAAAAKALDALKQQQENAEPGSPAGSDIALATAKDKVLLQLLSLIERQANELQLLNHSLTANKKLVLAAVQAAAEDPEQGASDVAKITPLVIPSLLGQGPLTPVGAAAGAVPTVVDEYESDSDASDGDDRLFTRDELLQKTIRSLAKRETRTAAAAAAAAVVARPGSTSQKPRRRNTQVAK